MMTSPIYQRKQEFDEINSDFQGLTVQDKLDFTAQTLGQTMNQDNFHPNKTSAPL